MTSMWVKNVWGSVDIKESMSSSEGSRKFIIINTIEERLVSLFFLMRKSTVMIKKSAHNWGNNYSYKKVEFT